MALGSDLAAEVRIARSDEMAALGHLFHEYADRLELDLSFQDFEREVVELPGPYQSPRGALLVACLRGEVVGCVGVRPFESRSCEMKRLYVRKEVRGLGIGRLLVNTVVAQARSLGYEWMVLDTVLPKFEAAYELYRSLGFKETRPYTPNRLPGHIVFMELDLREVADGSAGDPVVRPNRHPERATYEQQTIYEILDEGLICHVGFAVGGHPYVIPMLYVRRGSSLYLHGSIASRLLKALESGVDACVTVTLLDGIVLARSAFRHSLNYRSVVAYGKAVKVSDLAELQGVFQALIEKVAPGRWTSVRHPAGNEVAATMVVRLTLDAAVSKIRSGGPRDEKRDLDRPIWAGHIPLSLIPGKPVPDKQARN